MKIIETLSNKLGLSSQELKNKLGIMEQASRTEILNALDVYAIFDEKETLTAHINKKINNKAQELDALNLERDNALKEIEALKSKINNFEVVETNLKSLIKNEFDKIDFTTKTDFNQIDINKLDYSNLRTSILQQASELNWEVKEAEIIESNPTPEPAFKAKGILTRY